jgi:NADH:ubiquinone oxidoreductase subunit F (NADH-binding)/NADH:ubiquinone oxidoreductase subunit E
MTNKKIAYTPIDPVIEKLVQHHGGSREAVIEVLSKLNTAKNLNPATMVETARALQIPAHEVYGIATFYSMLAPISQRNVIRVCDGPVCWLNRVTLDPGGVLVEKWAEGMPKECSVERTSCLGLCDRSPAVLMNDEQAGPIEPEDLGKACQGWRGVPTDYSQPRKGELRVMLAHAGAIDPDQISSALDHGAYEGLRKALAMKPLEVINEVEKSGLQGRGGAGFPVGRKWGFVGSAKNHPKYLICNADESEPLIFKDRVLIDTNPHQVLEGMAIGAYACGVNDSWIYIRGEYVAQARRLERAILQAEQKGCLGDNIFGSGFSFHIHVHQGAGAYICGEETSLIESLEGKRGEPRLRPPFPPIYGFRGCPTAVNNIESFTAVPSILSNGVEWWRSLSNYPVPGTKIYMILGHVKNPGLVEAPFGLTLRQVINRFGGGMRKGSEFKFALTGGAAGTIVSSSLMDTPIDYASSQNGISLGAGAFMVCDQTVSVVAFLRELLHFFAVESCGKCTPCRVGTWRAHEILKSMAAGNGQKGNVEELRALAENMQLASFCGLGQSVPTPMNSALNRFTAEFMAAER